MSHLADIICETYTEFKTTNRKGGLSNNPSLAMCQIQLFLFITKCKQHLTDNPALSSSLPFAVNESSQPPSITVCHQPWYELDCQEALRYLENILVALLSSASQPNFEVILELEFNSIAPDKDFVRWLHLLSDIKTDRKF